MNNIIISSAPLKIAGEASATSITMRQIGSAIGIAVIGSVLASTLIGNMTTNIHDDPAIPDAAKPTIINDLKNIDIESGQITITNVTSTPIQQAIKHDIDKALVESTKSAMRTILYFLIPLIFISLLLPSQIKEEMPQSNGKTSKNQDKK